MTRAEAGRIAKFRRVLPRLVLDRPVHVARTAITVALAEPIDELCDVTLRLVHESGRTYAEQTRLLDAATGPIELARVVNLPDGRYDVVATPPLAEYFATTPVEVRLPLTVAGAAVVGGPASGPSLAALRAERAADGMGRGELIALLAALAGRLPLAARALARLDDPAAEAGLAAELAALAAAGLPASPAAIADTVAALAALTALGDAGTADFAAALLDRLLILLALAAAAGLVTLPSAEPAPSVRLDPLAPLTACLWGAGVADAEALPVRALALAAGYAPPPFLAALAGVAEPETSRIGLADGALACLHRAGGAVVASRPGHWIAGLGADLRLFADGAGLVGQRDGALSVRYDRPVRLWVPAWAFETVERGDSWFVGRAGRHVVALVADAPLVPPRAGAAAFLDLARPARLGIAVLTDATDAPAPPPPTAGSGFAPALAAGSGFAAALAAAGAAVEIEPAVFASMPAAADLALDSPYGRAGRDDTFRLRFAGYDLSLDLSGGGEGS